MPRQWHGSKPKLNILNIFNMFSYFLKSTSRLLASSMVWGLCMSTPAWAYKVEKICEDLPATSKEPAQKKCKVVRVVESVPAKGDGKGDGKADAKKNEKKDAKPAAH
jgi:hypothetical protein